MRISDWSSDVCSSDLRAFGETFHEGVVDALLDIEARRRDADLARVAEFLRDDAVERRLKVAVVEDQHRRMAAQFHRDPLHPVGGETHRSEEHTSELQSLMRISYAVFCLKKKKNNKTSYNKR